MEVYRKSFINTVQVTVTGSLQESGKVKDFEDTCSWLRSLLERQVSDEKNRDFLQIGQGILSVRW